jgi:hypothetical protein
MDNVLDRDWVKSAFMLPTEATIGGNEGVLTRIYSTSMQKPFDTTLGGNHVINPVPQFTRYADLKHNIFHKKSADLTGKNILVNSYTLDHGTTDTDTNGMGRTYSEKIDDNMQVVHFRMGVPQFNSMTSFYSNYYSVEAASLARTGRAPGFFYKLGWAVGSVATIPMLPFIMTAKVIKFFLRRPASKYYSLKPTMYPYWSAVSSMVNGIAASMGIIPRPIHPGNRHLYEKEGYLDGSSENSQEIVSEFHTMMPTIYRERGGIDIFAVAQRGQRLANIRRDLTDEELNKVTTRKQMRDIFRKRLYGEDIFQARRSLQATTLEAYQEIWANAQSFGSVEEMALDSDEAIDAAQKARAIQANSAETEPRTNAADQGFVDKYIDAFQSEQRMGSEFISFRVESTGTQTESFSNSTKEPTISSEINNIAASARETRFSMFDGNLEGTGIFAAGYGALKDVLSGISQGAGLQGLAQLSGNAFVDIPKVWDNSSADFNKLSLTIQLRSPYNDPMSRLQNIIVPMCCLFAMSVPLATGKQSHTSPFLVEYYAQGRAQSRLALVESLSFTRGVGDVGWTNNGAFMGVDVQMTLIDLSSAINMPLNPEHSLTDAAIQAMGWGAGTTVDTVMGYWGTETNNAGATKGEAVANAMLSSTYDDDNSYSDYLSILASIPLEAEINTARKWAIRLARQQAKFDDMRSPNRMAMWTTSGVFGDVIKAFSLAPERQ